MKAKVKLALPGYTGKMDDMVIYFNSKLNCLVARRYVKPKHTPANTDFRSAIRLAKSLELSAGYIQDCRNYVNLYNQRFRRQGRALCAWTNCFVKMLLQLKKHNPSLNLAALSRQEIVEQNYPVQTVRDAVEAGLLEKVSGYQDLASPM
jgi:hypothetical protein